MDNISPFFSYSSYLKRKYGQKAYRVGVDAGFSCPNRGNDRSNPGCSYCDETGARAVYLEGHSDTLLSEQVKRGTAFLKKRYNAELFLLYLQAFSNTFAQPQRLKKVYDTCLESGNFRELIVATRPDCIDREKAALLRSYKTETFDVWVELGLQSAHNRTLERINRGHTREQFEEAYRVLKEEKIKITVHLIFGLPGEGLKEILETVDYLGRLRPDGIKIHNLNIPYGTPMHREYLFGEITAPSARTHLEYTIEALRRLPCETVIMRLTCDTQKNKRVSPRIHWKKGQFYETIRTEMVSREINQGGLYFGPKGVES